jgi:hypothetical protein
MAWQPGNTCEKNEHVGRRLFDEPLLAGGENQRQFTGLSINHFVENRSDEFSVDRLGRSSIERSITSLLQPLAIEAGKTFHTPQTFHGWVVLQAARVKEPFKGLQVDLVPSPTVPNPYHAHIDTAGLCTAEENPRTRHYLVALHLRELFQTKGNVHAVSPMKARDSEPKFFKNLARRIKAFFSVSL